jgi:hypothetical protein
MRPRFREGTELPLPNLEEGRWPMAEEVEVRQGMVGRESVHERLRENAQLGLPVVLVDGILTSETTAGRPSLSILQD